MIDASPHAGSTSRRLSLVDCKYLPLILLLSFGLNIWGNRWGAPNYWHPDEIAQRAYNMFAEREPNPHHFAYGGLHYYTIWIGAVLPVKAYERLVDPPPPGITSPDGKQWIVREQARVIQMARTLSGIMSVLVVGLVFIMGSVLFDKRVGYLAALLLTVSMSFVTIAHFSTVDAPSNFWYWLACAFSLFIWKRGTWPWYFLAALAAGLAIGVKTDRLMILFPLLVSHFMRRESRQLSKLLWFAVLIPLGFVLANPALLMSPFEFLDGYSRDLFFNKARGVPGQTSYLTMLVHAKSGLGWPLFVAALAGVAFMLYHLVQRRNTAALAWLLITFAPYYVIFGSTSEIALWYLPIFFPGLMPCAAYAAVALMDTLPQRYTVAVKAAVAVIFVYSFLNSLSIALQFSNDSRYLANEWIEQNVPANTTIEMLARGPAVPREKYVLVNPPPDKEFYEFAMQWHNNLNNDQLYQKIRTAILDFERWYEQRSGTPARDEPYVGWFDAIPAMYEKTDNAAATTNGVE
ncbi:MAG: ArnT family glycosyltransferase, partial [bacterium]